MVWWQWLLYTAVSVLAIWASTYLKERAKNRAYIKDVGEIHAAIEDVRQSTEKELSKFNKYLENVSSNEAEKKAVASSYLRIIQDAYWFLILKALHLSSGQDLKELEEALWASLQSITSTFISLIAVTNENRDSEIITAGGGVLLWYTDLLSKLLNPLTDAISAFDDYDFIERKIERRFKASADLRGIGYLDEARKKLDELPSLEKEQDAAFTKALEHQRQARNAILDPPFPESIAAYVRAYRSWRELSADVVLSYPPDKTVEPDA